jgi:dTDP-L-rhamnose 4-epimerase
MKNILITGGAGFIGSNLALNLIDRGYKVRVLDNLSPQIHGATPESSSSLFQSIADKVDFIFGTVSSKNDWLNAIEGQDAIIHLAAETGTGQSMYEIHKYTDINITGTAIMLDILANNNHTIKKVIVASSRAIYGEGKYKCPEHGIVYPNSRIDQDMKSGDFECKCTICGSNLELLSTSEDSKIHPSSLYGITKQTQEQMVLTIGKALNIPSVAFRYQNVYGPGQSLSNPYTGILSIFSNLLINNSPVNIFEDGLESRDFVFIDDVVEATILGLEKSEADYSVFNVGTGIPIDVKTVLNELIVAYASRSEFCVSGNFRVGDIRHNFADISYIKEKLNFAPKISFKEGITLFSEWVKNQAMPNSQYQNSLDEMKAKGLLK